VVLLFKVVTRGFKEAIGFYRRRYAEAVERGFENFLEDWAKHMKNYTQVNHPWMTRTGRLERSHFAERVNPLFWKVVADARREGATKNYAMFLEYGTSHNAPHPWFGPAVETHRDFFKRDAKKVLERAKKIAMAK